MIHRFKIFYNLPETSGIDRPFSDILLQALNVVSVEQHGGVVLGGSNEHGAVLAGLHVSDSLGMI